MKNYKILIGFVIIFILLYLTFMFRQYIFFLPIICVIPMSCGINRRSERNNQETNQIPQLSQHQGYKKSCPFCEKDIKEESIRFCPNCGTKL